MPCRGKRASEPLISVVLPAYCAESTIGEAIQSIQLQTFPAWELILIDDGSTDETARIALSHAARDARIRVIRREHRGLVATLEEGCHQARADIIARMDADDIAHPMRFEKQWNYSTSHPEVQVIGSLVEHFSDSSHCAGMAHYVAWSNGLIDEASIALQRFVDCPMVHPSICFRKQIWVRLGGYREGVFPEDWEMLLRWMDVGVRCAKVSETLLKWRDHARKLTRVDPRYSEHACWSMKGYYIAKFLEQHLCMERPLLIWGAGRKTRSRLNYIPSIGEKFAIRGFIDIDPRKTGKRLQGVDVLGPEDAMSIPHSFILVMVGSRGAREIIDHYLKMKGRIEGQDYLFTA